MKKKSSLILPIYVVGAVIIASVIRFFQYSSIIDFKTGFFNRGAELPGMLIYFLVIAIFAVFIVLAILGKKSGDAAYFLSSDGMGEHATQFLGVAEILAAILTAYQLFTGVKGITQIIVVVIISAALLISGMLLLRNIVPPTITGHLLMLCAICMFLRTANWFLSDLTILHHSDNLLTLLAYVVSAAFYATISRFFSRYETKKSRMREILTAGLTFILSGLHVVSKCIAMLFGGSAVEGMTGINPDVGASALISLVFLLVLFTTKKEKNILYLFD